MASRATAYLAAEPDLLLADLIVADTVYVLESFYEAPRSMLAMPSTDRIDFAEAYLVACAESTGVDRVVSFHKAIDRVETVKRITRDTETPSLQVTDVVSAGEEP